MKIREVYSLVLFAGLGVFAAAAAAQESQVPESAPTETTPPKPSVGDTYRDVVFDQADVLPPRASYQYWLDTVATNDEEFTAILKGAPEAAPDRRYSADELRQERIKRLEASFDFDAFFEAAGEKLNPALKEHRKREMYRYFLSEQAREKFHARNVRALATPEAPDWERGAANVYLKIRDTVSGDDVLYKVHLKLYPRGLCWRWYKSEKWEQDVPAAEATTDESADIDARVARLDREIADIAARVSEAENALKEVELALRSARESLAERQTRRDELLRQKNPYGTPEAGFRTGFAALKDGNWEKFFAAHSKRVREAAGEAARARFRSSAEGREISGFRIVESIPVAADPDRMTLKVELTLKYRKAREYDPETGKFDDSLTTKDERRILTLRMVREAGRWLLDEDL